MRIGLDTFTIRELNLDFIGQLDYIKNHGLEGAQMHDMPSELSEMKEIKSHADNLDLFTYIAITPCNFLYTEQEESILLEKLTKDIQNAAECGWHELRTIMGDHLTRYEHKQPWKDHMSATIQLLKKLAPVLREHGSRLNIENHGDATTSDLIRITQKIGEDIIGICLDTGNLLVLGEDPVMASERAAPYVHLTHAKDAILFFCDKGICRQGRAPGSGIVDWSKVLGNLSKQNPNLPIAIEDHKWLFEIPIYESSWHKEQPELSTEELSRFVSYAASCQEQLSTGALPNPNEYEAIPYLEQMEDRISSGRDYLNQVLKSLKYKNLRSY